MQKTLIALATGLCALLAAPPLAARIPSPAPAADPVPATTSAPATCGPAATVTSPAAFPTITAHPALWKIADADTTVYLFGTIHFLRPGIDWLNGPVKTAFEASDQLVLEMLEPDASAAQPLMMQRALNPTGPTLTEKLPPERRAEFARALADAGLPQAVFDRTDPWFAATILSVATIAKAGYDPGTGPESVLTAAARTPAQGATPKHLTGLETFEEQLDFLDRLPESEQIRMLEETLEDLPRGETMFADMLKAWADGDPDRLAVLINEEMDATPLLTERLLYERNRRWATWLEERLKTPGTAFVAVGAGHLAGQKSVLDLLGKDGVTVTRLR